jgi:hypothetical protein
MRQIVAEEIITLGWNEIAESNSAQANVALRELERDFPSAGSLPVGRGHAGDGVRTSTG